MIGMSKIVISKIALPLALVGGLLVAGTSAEARDGCGPGFHRGYYGWCRPNLGYRPFVYAPGYRVLGYRRWGGGYRWHRGFGWHGGGHRWGGFRHAGWHGGHGWGGHRRW